MAIMRGCSGHHEGCSGHQPQKKEPCKAWKIWWPILGPCTCGITGHTSLIRTVRAHNEIVRKRATPATLLPMALSPHFQWPCRPASNGPAALLPMALPPRFQWPCRPASNGPAAPLPMALPPRFQWPCRPASNGPAVPLQTALPPCFQWPCHPASNGPALHLYMHALHLDLQ